MDRSAIAHSWAHSGLWWKRKYLQIKTGEKFPEKLLCDVCIPLRELYLFSHKAVFEHCSCKTEKVIFCSAWKSMVKSEIFWGKTQKAAFQETAFWHVHSFQRVKAYTTLPSLENLSLRNLWRDIKCHPEACSEQWNIFPWKRDRSFQSYCLVMCVFIS